MGCVGELNVLGRVGSRQMVWTYLPPALAVFRRLNPLI